MIIRNWIFLSWLNDLPQCNGILLCPIGKLLLQRNEDKSIQIQQKRHISSVPFLYVYVFFKIKGGKRIMFFCFLNNVIFFFTFVGELYYCEHSREKKSVNVFICCNDIYLSKNFATSSLAKSAICFWKKIKVVHQIIIHLVHKI